MPQKRKQTRFGIPKEVDPINLKFCMTNTCFDSTQIYNQQCNIDINWIRISIIGILFFIENIQSCYIIPLPQCYAQRLSLDTHHTPTKDSYFLWGIVQGYRTKPQRAPAGSLMRLAYSTNSTQLGRVSTYIRPHLYLGGRH